MPTFAGRVDARVAVCERQAVQGLEGADAGVIKVVNRQLPPAGVSQGWKEKM